MLAGYLYSLLSFSDELAIFGSNTFSFCYKWDLFNFQFNNFYLNFKFFYEYFMNLKFYYGIIFSFQRNDEFFIDLFSTSIIIPGNF